MALQEIPLFGQRGDTNIVVRGDRLLSHSPEVRDLTGGDIEQTDSRLPLQFIALHGLTLARSLVHRVMDPKPVYRGMHFVFDNLFDARDAAGELAQRSIDHIRRGRVSGLIFGRRELDDLEEHLPYNFQTGRFDYVLASDVYPIGLVVEGGFGDRCTADTTRACMTPLQLHRDLAPSSYKRLLRFIDYSTSDTRPN